jgi:peptidoglycan/LPS O-acetylase OafA/YrhL
VLRIFPIAYLLLAIMLFFRPWWEIGWCAIYLSNYRFFVFDQVFTPLSHYWSLAVEEHFYLLWPWVVYGLSFRNSRAMVCYGIIPAAIVSGIVLTLVLPSESARMFLWYGTQSRMASLALGALFAFGEGWLRHDTRRAARMAAVMFGAFLLIHRDGEYLPRSAEQMIRFLGFAMLSGCLVLTAINMGRCRTPFSKCLDNPPLRYVGRISYGLYLYHAPIYFAFGMWDESPANHTVVRLAEAVLLSLLAAWLSFIWIERPILQFKNRLGSSKVWSPASPLVSDGQIPPWSETGKLSS